MPTYTYTRETQNDAIKLLGEIYGRTSVKKRRFGNKPAYYFSNPSSETSLSGKNMLLTPNFSYEATHDFSHMSLILDRYSIGVALDIDDFSAIDVYNAHKEFLETCFRSVVLIKNTSKKIKINKATGKPKHPDRGTIFGFFHKRVPFRMNLNKWEGGPPKYESANAKEPMLASLLSKKIKEELSEHIDTGCVGYVGKNPAAMKNGQNTNEIALIYENPNGEKNNDKLLDYFNIREDYFIKELFGSEKLLAAYPKSEYQKEREAELTELNNKMLLSEHDIIEIPIDEQNIVLTEINQEYEQKQKDKRGLLDFEKHNKMHPPDNKFVMLGGSLSTTFNNKSNNKSSSPNRISSIDIYRDIDVEKGKDKGIGDGGVLSRCPTPIKGNNNNRVHAWIFKCVCYFRRNGVDDLNKIVAFTESSLRKLGHSAERISSARTSCQKAYDSYIHKGTAKKDNITYTPFQVWKGNTVQHVSKLIKAKKQIGLTPEEAKEKFGISKSTYYENKKIEEEANNPLFISTATCAKIKAAESRKLGHKVIIKQRVIDGKHYTYYNIPQVKIRYSYKGEHKGKDVGEIENAGFLVETNPLHFSKNEFSDTEYCCILGDNLFLNLSDDLVMQNMSPP